MHEIEAFYVINHVTASPYSQCVLKCGCGFSSDKCANWEDAGRQMDGHLDEIDSDRDERKEPKS